MNNSNINIAVLCGGISSERDISINSGYSIYGQIKGDYKSEVIEYNNNFESITNKLKTVSLVFNALHGGDGENGNIQAVLDMNHIKYSGSGAEACQLAMNKNVSKLIVNSLGISTPKWKLLSFGGFETINSYQVDSEKISFPIVVKPNNEGSTVGVSIVESEEGLEKAIELSSQFSNQILIEEFIEGKEITVGILGNKALPVLEIIPKKGFYDYENKYNSGACNYMVPAEIDETTSLKIQEDSLRIFKAIGCRHYGRLDFRLNAKNEYYFLELNTLPGLSETSLFPRAAESFGLSYKDLLDKIVQIASIDNG